MVQVSGGAQLLLARGSRRRRAGSLAAALLASTGCLAGCSSAPVHRAAASSRAAPGPPTVKDGHLTFSVLGLTCGLTAVAGTHSEGTPEGQYCRVWLRVVNADPAEHDYVARRQLIAGVPKADATPSAFAMAVRRQLDRVPIGGHDAIEVEVWYDVPKGAHVTGLRLGGDRDQVGFLDTSTVPYARGGAFVPVVVTSVPPP